VAVESENSSSAKMLTLSGEVVVHLCGVSRLRWRYGDNRMWSIQKLELLGLLSWILSRKIEAVPKGRFWPSHLVSILAFSGP
jgi:hypothetical protein